MFSALVLYILDLYMPRVCYTHKTHTFVCVQAYKSDNGKPVGQGPLCILIFFSKSKKEKEATVHYVEAITRGFKDRGLRHAVHRKNSSPLVLHYCSVVHGIGTN